MSGRSSRKATVESSKPVVTLSHRSGLPAASAIHVHRRRTPMPNTHKQREEIADAESAAVAMAVTARAIRMTVGRDVSASAKATTATTGPRTNGIAFNRITSRGPAGPSRPPRTGGVPMGGLAESSATAIAPTARITAMGHARR